MPDFTVDQITDANLDDKQETLAVVLKVVGPEPVTLRMNWRIANQMLDTIRALNDQAITRAGPQVPGAQTGAYRNARKVDVVPDMTLTKLLVDFDREAPHRVGVAISVDEAESWGQQLIAHAKKVREYQQKQRRQ